MRTPDQIAKMPSHRRRMLRLQKRFRHYKKHPRPTLSPEELLTYLRDHQIHSQSGLAKARGNTDPMLYDYRKVFGSWSEALRQAHGSEMAVDMKGEYVEQAVFDLGLWTVDKFRAARKVDPVSIPSWRVIKREWGGYRNLFECARRKHLKYLMGEYRKLYRKIGHVPTLDEIREANLRMETVMDFYGGKKEMDDFVLFGIGVK